MSVRTAAALLVIVAFAGSAGAAPKGGKGSGKARPKPVPAAGMPDDPYAPVVPPPVVAPVPTPGHDAHPGKPSQVPDDPYVVAAIPPRLAITDLPAVQGLLAVQHLGGWLLCDREGENPIARRLVAPIGNPSHVWFYLLPAKGAPVKLVYAAEQHDFDHVAGSVITYTGHKDMAKQLAALLKGRGTVAVEYSVRAAVPAVSRVDAGTIELIRATGVKIASSSNLVQYAKATWGDAGRTAHGLAAHHLEALKVEAMAWLAAQLQQGGKISEYDLQQHIVRGMTTRGLVGPPPAIATGANTADPFYVPTVARTQVIARGDLLVVGLAGKLARPDGIYAALTWVIAVDAAVQPDAAQAFAAVKAARDAAIATITDRVKQGRPISGAEVDRAARAYFKKAGFSDRVLHRTGHSLDDDLNGSGADLDDYDVQDTRILTVGTGFTIGPGLYAASAFGVRTEVSAFLTPGGVELSTATQDAIEPLFAK